jgi:hypothetical protein
MFFMSSILAVLNDGVIPIINQFRIVMECDTVLKKCVKF